MKKPIPTEFHLTNSKVFEYDRLDELYKHALYRKDRGDGFLLPMWFCLMGSGGAFYNGNDSLGISLAVSGLIFAGLVALAKKLRPRKPQHPENYFRYKNALEDYTLWERKEQERLANEEKERLKTERKVKQKTYDYWIKIDPYEFELEIARLFKKHGFTAQVTKGSGDEGIDIKLSKNGRKGVVQCKRYRSKVGPSTARDLYGVMMHGRFDFGLIVCPSSFSNKTFEFTRNKNITLIGLKRIIEMTKDDALDFLQF